MTELLFDHFKKRDSMDKSSDIRTSSVLSTEVVGTRTKVDRYNWSKPEDPGELCWIDKTELLVDHKYQRDADDKKATRLASEFDWPAFGVLIVARRPGNKLYVAEGQHRYLAAMKRADIKLLPCIVFDSTGVANEAKIFLDANANRKPVSAAVKFKASVMIKDPVALHVKSLAEATGRSIASYSGPNTIACSALLMKLSNKHRDTLNAVWPVIADVCEGDAITDRIVDSLVYIEANLKSGESLTNRRWWSRLKSIGSPELHRAMASSAAYFSGGGAKVWASGIVRRLNKGLTESKQLTVDGLTV